MKLDSYLAKNESVTKEVEAFESVDAVSDSRKGKLACTPNRVVYVQGENVIDISLNGINSIEFSAPSYPKSFLYWGGGFGVLAFLTGVAEFVGDSSIPDLMLAIVFFGLISLAILVAGQFLKRSTIKFRTPNTTYTFASTDRAIQDIAHAVRGHE
ncbi:hypothetical protein [Halorussus aquaticus]|uniref:Uncharacterized protein n=1 Tax=Halorussus aquaticus TaxID=2953748 RepID=A0ABD5Q179_9EURY